MALTFPKQPVAVALGLGLIQLLGVVGFVPVQDLYVPVVVGLPIHHSVELVVVFVVVVVWLDILCVDTPLEVYIAWLAGVVQIKVVLDLDRLEIFHLLL